MDDVFERLWPIILDSETAKEAAQYGFWGAVALAAITAGLAVFGHLGIFGVFGADLWALIDAALFALVAYGIHKMSRAAAVAGLLLYVVGRINVFIVHGLETQSLVVTVGHAILFGLAFLHGVRGTFAYHKYRQTQGIPG